MRKALRSAAALIAIFIFAGLTWQVGHTQDPVSEFFHQTRHSVQGPFLDFYRAAPNPELVYGYPITEAFLSKDGLTVQYFQRARFELHSDGQVVLTPLGARYYQPGRGPAEGIQPTAACRAFDTGFQVCTAFLAFYEANGGLGQFGPPISPVEKDGMRYVQFFEYARLEWYPETADPRLEVQVGLLGQLYFEQQREDRAHLAPLDNSAIIQITDLRLHVFAARAAVTGRDAQSLYAVVQDQTFAPVPGVVVTLRVQFPSGRELTYAETTNAHGFIEVPLAVNADPVSGGPVIVEARASAGDLARSALTSFRILP